jgi:ubiquinone/menaquinone biosynthesis C-methylase UbiE
MSADPTSSERVEQLLARPEIHEQWSGDYRTAENRAFYETAFDALRDVLCVPGRVLDVGCGTGHQTLRLAARGATVCGVDLSCHVLAAAKAAVASRELTHCVSLCCSNILTLPFADRTFDGVLCWGVLMHVPEVATAVAELARVLKRGACLVVSEGNMHSAQARLLRFARQVLRREKARVTTRPAGIEYWIERESGALVTREADIGWLIRECDRHDLSLASRRAGQFTELYTRAGSPRLRRAIHAWNHFWFTRVRNPQLAFGNILVFRKR